MGTWDIQNWGQISYAQAIKQMQVLHAKRVKKEISDTLLLLQHDPVITKGRRLEGEAVPDEKNILKKGIAIEQTDRGGLLTYHGPGQVVIYFVFCVEDYFSGVVVMVQEIEKVLLNFLKVYGVKAQIRKDHPGIWIEEKKIASIGLRVSQGVTRHGIAFNIANDLLVYDLFNPCGLSGNVMTSLSQILKKTFSEKEVWYLGEHLVNLYQEGFQNGKTVS